MSVNTMQIEDVYQLINTLHTQATGRSAPVPTNTGEFVSMAQATLRSGVDNVYSTLMQVCGRTVYSVRPYERKFPDFISDGNRWGGIMRKISMADKDIQRASAAWNQLDGSTVDPWIINKSNVLETRFYGSGVYQDSYTTYRKQLMNAFTGPEQLGSFVSMQVTEMSNKWEQYLENLARATLANLVAAKKATNNSVFHMITEYNTETGLNLTIQDIWKEDYAGAFFRWLRARINTLSDQMTDRTQLFQNQITGKEITRHTPLADQRMYLSQMILRRIDTMVNTTTYHDEPLAYAGVYGVNYWQSSQAPLKISATPEIMTAAGAIETAENQVIENVLGVIMDRDCCTMNIKDYSVDPAPYNPRGEYWNTWLNAHLQYCTDLTEKAIVLLLD